MTAGGSSARRRECPAAREAKQLVHGSKDAHDSGGGQKRTGPAVLRRGEGAGVISSRKTQRRGQTRHPRAVEQRAELRDQQALRQNGAEPPLKHNHGITLDNWEQKSKQIAQLAMQNEMNELMAKERLGKLPPQPSAMPQQQQRAPQQMSQQKPGMRGAAPPQVVSMHGSYDPFDDRMPRQMQSGGKVMNSSQAQVQRRGQTSSIVFG